MAKKTQQYKRCGFECFDYKEGAAKEFYCSHGPKLRRVHEGQICAYKLVKPKNEEYDDQGFPKSIPADKLAELARSPAKRTGRKLSLDETTKNSMSTHNFMQQCYRHQPAR